MKLGIDTGGTFTDFILQTEEGVRTYKVSSTPDDPSRAILAGILHFFPQEESGTHLTLPRNLEIIHGTTVGTNAFLQRKGARTLLVTTSGFEDVLVIGRQNRASLYDLDIERPAEIITDEQRVGVMERMRWDGTVQRAPGKSVGKRLRSLCRRLGIESVAVCFLHAYANPVHEQQIAAALAPLAIPVSISSAVLPEFREYERLTTTLINGYLAPVIASYVDRLSEKLSISKLYIQQSNGGILPARSIGERAVHTVLSGPAGGVHGAFKIARQMGLEQIITFDMGGTSTDVSLCDRKPTVTRDYRIDGYPLRIQVLDIHTVGAGGGSIAAVDRGGILHVGPSSAGADPGPVCYGKGEHLTVTDANVFLGRLLADRFLGGEMPLFPERVAEKMEGLAERLALAPAATALGIIRLVNIGMAKAIRAVTLERGYDPKECALFSFGGASGLHCCELAKELAIGKIVVPARAGILSAQGMVMAEPTLDGSRALFLVGDAVRGEALDPEFDLLVAEKKQEMEELCQAGEIRVERFVDLRYQGQSFEISVAYGLDFKENFHRQHEHHFGYMLPDAPLEVTAIRCTLKLHRPTMALPRAVRRYDGRPVSEGRTEVFFAGGEEMMDVYSRSRLQYGHTLEDPALIVDDYTTILVPAGFRLEVDPFLNLIITRK